MFATLSTKHLKAIAFTSITLTTAACARPSNNQAISPKASSKIEQFSSNKVIYGVDTRHDLYAEPNVFVRLVADSTAAVVHTDQDLTMTEAGRVAIRQISFGKSHMLCQGERFFDQSSAPFCSSFLVSPDTMVSAGHCITSEEDCAKTSFIFGYSYRSPDDAPTSISNDNVYRCSHVVHTQEVSTGADFSVVKLDRVVWNHVPLRMRTSGAITTGEGVTALGYPSGLPLKIADGARVRSSSDGYFTANLNTYAGNSGSAVVNSATLEVEGVLVRGERDFVPTDDFCMISNICPADGCRGEDVTKIAEVQKYLGNE